MNAQHDLDADPFETERARLQGLAYRMLGSVADAQDVVQEAWLRWARLGDDGRAQVLHPAAWLTTCASRLALDKLKSAQRQREEYIGPWLPEPILTDGDPAVAAELAESLTIGFLAVLERLGPVERAVFLLADVFAEPYSVIAPVVGCSEEACRQIASRARQRVRQERQLFHPAAARRDQLLHAFMAACAFGQIDDLRRVLSDDVVLVSDGGREVHAARRPVLGIPRVGRLLTTLTKRVPADVQIALHEVNGEPGLVFTRDGVVTLVMVFEVWRDRIAAIRIMLNPAKLAGVQAVVRGQEVSQAGGRSRSPTGRTEG
ncbi:MAG: RNA polymerase sigma factor SigJ [Ilumatobacteraceae bacterium]